MGSDPLDSVTDLNYRLHFSPNTYVSGPALFPSIGSPNPMLTGVALTRRMGDALVPPPAPFQAEAGFIAIFNGFDMSKWSMSKISNQPRTEATPGGS